ncbi:hypothetical protein CFOL_v3_21416 [Cephalotus follicularis]|uniref:Uncharacterized protein n=1 Tax=Cephalotus follicularis TaxID=3775 RepID=A0A1Q3CCV1_CEPFO|nr:hypothetical protein CFOL_v3_21416 [Cephalotus follicularis]
MPHFKPSYPYNKQVKIVVVTMALYNFIRRNSTQDTDFETSDTHDLGDAYGIQDVQSEATRISESATQRGGREMEIIRDAITRSLMASR